MQQDYAHNRRWRGVPGAGVRRAGFSLMEVLIAMGVFLIGSVAIASLFPVAIISQQGAMSDITSHHVARHVEALMRGRGLRLSQLNSWAGSSNYRVQQPASFKAQWGDKDRSYPSFIAEVEDRRFFWEPLLRRNPNGTFSGYAFVLEKERRADAGAIPTVVSSTVTAAGSTFSGLPANHGLQAGDWVLDSNGVTYMLSAAGGTTVTVYNNIVLQPEAPTELWYGERLNNAQRSSGRRIMVFTDIAR